MLKLQCRDANFCICYNERTPFASFQLIKRLAKDKLDNITDYKGFIGYFVSDIHVLYLKVLLKGCHWFTIIVKIEKEVDFLYIFPVELFCCFCSLFPILKSNALHISMFPIHHDQDKLQFLSLKHESFHTQCNNIMTFPQSVFSPRSSKYRDILTFSRYFTKKMLRYKLIEKKSYVDHVSVGMGGSAVSLWAPFYASVETRFILSLIVKLPKCQSINPSMSVNCRDILS